MTAIETNLGMEGMLVETDSSDQRRLFVILVGLCMLTLLLLELFIGTLSLRFCERSNISQTNKAERYA
jgi:hypothetical protein